MINSRTKGAAAERELFKIISTSIGIPVERNLIQTREGGADTSVGEWAIEVKRQEVLSITAWWAQAVEQSLRVNQKPMLIYRRSRQPWKVIIYAEDLVVFYGGTVISEELVEVSLQMGIQILKDSHEGSI